ncbi:hypothetical protein [Pandoraea terrigena]|nr:hypothetical protein [Pandoraea terrigena]
MQARLRASPQTLQTAEMARAPLGAPRRESRHAAFALGLLAVIGTTGVVAAASAPGTSIAGARSISRRDANIEPSVSTAPITLPHSETVSGMHALLRVWPLRRDGGGVMAQCLPAPHIGSLGAETAPADSREALRAGLTVYRGEIQRAMVALIRQAVAASDAETRDAFANAEVLRAGLKSLLVEHEAGLGSRPPRSIYAASHAISLHLRHEGSVWFEFVLSLAHDASALITPWRPCSSKKSCAQTYGPVLWGERWSSIQSRIGEGDDAGFVLEIPGAPVWAGWPSPNSSVLDSPDMEEVAELLIDTVVKRAPRDRRELPDASFGARSRRHAVTDIGGPGELASRLAVSGMECLAAMVRAETLHQDAIALLQYLWPGKPMPASAPAAPQQAPLPSFIKHESFSGPLGRGVQWCLPPNVHVEYLPDLTQNGVKVFDIDGVLYGAAVAHTRKHASDLRPLEDIRRDWAPGSLCRISRGAGIDIDGMCLECHRERQGEVTVTEQGATVAQHQAMAASPLVRLRVAMYSRLFQAADGGQVFFAFGRLGRLDEFGTPHVSPDSPLVDPALYTPELNGELAFYEQPTTEGPVGGRRVRLTLGDMCIAAPFGTYRDGDGALHGVVQLSRDVYYRFTLPDSDEGEATRQVHLHRRPANHRDIRAYRTAQLHRAAAENAIVLPTIAYGEARTLLQLYLKLWHQAPSPGDVWRGLEDISLSVIEARQAIRDLTQAIEHRVTASRMPPVSPGASGFSPPPGIDAALMPMFNRLWSHWQYYPMQAGAFTNAIARDFVSRPAPLAVWSQLPFVGDVQTTRDVLSIFETLFPGMSGMQALVGGTARAARDVGERMRHVSRNANIAVAEVTLADGTRTIYYCLSGLQRTALRTNTPSVRVVDAGRAYARRDHNVIAQRRKAASSGREVVFTEPPELRLAMADADLPTYNAATRGPQSRTLDTERMILAQIYADHPLGENVIRSIVLCSRLPFCDSCAVNLAMVPYHYPDAELRFYYVAPPPRERRTIVDATPVPIAATAQVQEAVQTVPTVLASGQDRSDAHASDAIDPHEHSSL